MGPYYSTALPPGMQVSDATTSYKASDSAQNLPRLEHESLDSELLHSKMSCRNSDESPTTWHDDTIRELERLSAAAVTAMSQRDWDFTQTPEAREVLEHIANNWTATFDNYPQKLNFAEQIAAHQDFMKENPMAYYQLREMSTVLAEDHKTASVFLKIDIKEVNGMTIGGQSEFRWRRRGDAWFWYYHLAMRGATDF